MSNPTHSSSKQLARPAFFYHMDQIRFRQFSVMPLKRHVRTNFTVASNPWLSLKDDDIGQLIQRLDDKPDELYSAIKAKANARNKFILLQKNCGEKQNESVMASLERQKLGYQRQFRTLLQQRKTSRIEVRLPRVESIRYIFGDRLHRLKGKENKQL